MSFFQDHEPKYTISQFRPLYRFFVAMNIPFKCALMLFVLALFSGCVSNNLGGSPCQKGEEYTPGEEMYRLICNGSKSDRAWAIKVMSEALASTNRTSAQIALAGIPDRI